MNISIATNTFMKRDFKELYHKVYGQLGMKFSKNLVDLQFLLSEGLLTGRRASDCKIPCLRTKSSIIQGPYSKAALNYTSLFFAFVDEVTTKSITVDKFDFMEALNFLGSNMGLWPGLGIFQLIEGAFIITIASKIFKSISNIFLKYFFLKTK